MKRFQISALNCFLVPDFPTFLYHLFETFPIRFLPFTKCFYVILQLYDALIHLEENSIVRNFQASLLQWQKISLISFYEENFAWKIELKRFNFIININFLGIIVIYKHDSPTLISHIIKKIVFKQQPNESLVYIISKISFLS